MVKHNIESTNDVLLEIALETYQLKIENATLSTLLIKSGAINADEYKEVYEALQSKGKASYLAKLLNITEAEAEVYLNEPEE